VRRARPRPPTKASVTRRAEALLSPASSTSAAPTCGSSTGSTGPATCVAAIWRRARSTTASSSSTARATTWCAWRGCFARSCSASGRRWSAASIACTRRSSRSSSSACRGAICLPCAPRSASCRRTGAPPGRRHREPCRRRRPLQRRRARVPRRARSRRPVAGAQPAARLRPGAAATGPATPRSVRARGDVTQPRAIAW